MHERRGNFCIFLLKIAEKEGKTDLRADTAVDDVHPRIRVVRLDHAKRLVQAFAFADL